MRLTRICATIGPASASPAVLARLVAAGMDVARLNFSHGTVAEHVRVVRRIRAAAQRAGRPVAVLQDLQGPRVRVGRLRDAVPLAAGQRVRLLAGRPRIVSLPAGEAALPVTHACLPADVKPGEPLLLRDGAVRLRVLRTDAGVVLTEVELAGVVTSGAGLNAPESALSVPALTARDRDHLRAGLEMGVDAIALSFVGDADDVVRARRLVTRSGGAALIVAKIERRRALDHLDAIAAAADGVIVARGDLGVECPVETVPLLQKEIVRAAARNCSFVMTATHMLESMIEHLAPTRAEVSDVANAVLDGVDTIMLSGETAHGRFPVEAVATMDRIARRVEQEGGEFQRRFAVPAGGEPEGIGGIVAAAIGLAERERVRAIAVKGGDLAVVGPLAACRRGIPILVLVERREEARQLVLLRGVLPIVGRTPRSLSKVLARGDQVVIVEPASVRLAHLA